MQTDQNNCVEIASGNSCKTGTCAENPNSKNEDDRVVICMGERESTFIISSKTDANLTTDLSAFGWGLIIAGSLYFLIWLLIICLS